MNSTWRAFVEQLSIVIALDEKTGDLGKATDRVEKIFEGISYMAGLSSFKMTYSIIDSIYVYDLDNDTVYTSLRTQYAARDFKDLGWLAQIDPERSAQWIDVREAPVIMTTGNTSVGATTVYHTYVRTLSPALMGIDGYVVVNVSESRLMALLLGQSSLDTLHILEENNVVVSSTDKSLVGKPYDDPAGVLAGGDFAQSGAAVLLGGGSSGSGTFTGAYQPRRAYYGRGAFRYVGTINSAAYLSSIYALRLFLLITAAGCLLLGFPLCYMLSKKMYNPIRQLLEEFDRTEHAHGEELAGAVRAALHNVVARNSWLSALRKDERKDGAALFALALHKGEGPYEARTAQALASCPPYPYAVLLAAVDEPYFNRKGEHLLPYLHQVLCELFTSAAGNPAYRVYAASAGVFSAALAVPTEGGDAQGIERMIAEVRKMLSMVFEGSVTFAVSQVRTDMKRVGDSYLEAEKALRCRFTRGLGQTIFYSDQMEHAQPFPYPREQINRALSALDAKDDAGLDAALSELFGAIGRADGDIDDILTVYYQLVGRFVQRLAAANIKPADLLPGEQAALYTYMTHFEAASHMNEWIRSLFFALRDFESSYSRTKNRYLSDLERYVNENYTRELLPAEVARELGISYSYLRKLMSAELQLSFVDYVNAVRIRHAKTLLADRSIILREVACRSGFSNEQSFSRAFKKSEGMSPGMYRK